MGPVIPCFPSGAPQWLKKGNIFDRKRLRTGTRLTTHDTRTGNVLLSRAIFPEGSMWFDSAFGRTGGEDADFFKRQIRSGRGFVWCDEAEVYESVPSDRQKASFHLKKFFRIGTLNGERLRRNGILGFIAIMKFILAMPVWIILLLISSLFGKHVWIHPILKIAYSSGCLLAYCGVSIIRYRD